MPRRLDSSYDDSHRAFLQAFMARGTLTYSEAKPLLAAILTAHEGSTVAPGAITQEVFAEYISAAGNAVSDLDYEVRSSIPQRARSARTDSHVGIDDDGGEDDNDDAPERVYALINSTSDDLTQLATTFTPDELAFVKRVLDEMFDHGGGGGGGLRRELCGLQGGRALQLHAPRDRETRDAAARRRASAQGNTTLTQDPEDDDDGGTQTQGTQGARAQPISMSQAQGVLDNLLAQGWFERSRKGFYSLTPRALMELRTWLVDTYNDEDEDMEDDGDDGASSGQRIKLCQACREIVTVGQRCPKLTCPVRLHDGCTRRFFRMQKAERCPVCKADWRDHGYVGERAANQGQRRTTGAASSQHRNSRRRSDLDGAGDDDDNNNQDEEDDEDESMQ